MATCPTCRTHYSDETATCAADGSTLLPDAAFKGVDNDLTAGDVVADYCIEAKIGQGGFGAVYKAIHPLIGKAAAVKVLGRDLSSKPEMVSRFISEARAVNQIRHKGIIDIFAFGALPDGRQYYIMELLEGTTLDAFMRSKGPLPLAQAIPILRGVARAIDAAHTHGIAHRDLKPENVFLTFDDEGRAIPKILDFGIAKLMGETSGASKTQTGTPMGTPHYMSPEQSRGVGVDKRTDVYSFGVMAYEMITGKLPFDGEAVMDILLKQITAEAAPPSTVRDGIAPGVDAAILRMMEKDADKRPQTLSAAADELAQAAAASGELPVSSQPSLPVRSTPMLSPVEMEGLAQAKTMLGQGPQTLNGAANEVPPKSARKTRAFAAAVAVAAVIGVGAFFATRRTDDRRTAGLVDTATTSATVATSPSMSASVAITPALPASVNVTIQGAPPEAEIFRGELRLGSAASPLAVTRDEAVTLTIRAKGFVSKDVVVTPKSDEVIAVTLDKIVGPAHAGSGHKQTKEIENPF